MRGRGASRRDGASAGHLRGREGLVREELTSEHRRGACLSEEVLLYGPGAGLDRSSAQYGLFFPADTCHRKVPRGTSHSFKGLRFHSGDFRRSGRRPAPRWRAQPASVLDEDEKRLLFPMKRTGWLLLCQDLSGVRVSLPHHRLFSPGCEGFL